MAKKETKKETKKELTQVALAPAVVPLLKKVGLYGTAAVAGAGADELIRKVFSDDKDNTKKTRVSFDPNEGAKALKEMIKEETKKAKKKGLKGGIETDFYEDKGKVPLRKRIKKARKGGLIRSKPRDGIAKKGKTKGRIIRGVLNK